jgi:signal transduction histidine kinase
MTTRRWLLLTAAVLGLVWVIGAEWASIRDGVQENHFLDALVGMTFIGAGLVAIDRRSGNVIGPLMIAYGAIGYFANWTHLGTIPLFPMLATVNDLLAAALIAHIALVYPSGRLRSRFDRTVLWLTYGTLGATTLLAVLVYPLPRPGCACPWVPHLFPNPEVFERAYDVNQQLAFVLVPLFFAAVVRRWWGASRAERRALLPLWIAVALLAAVYLLGAFASRDTSDPFAYMLWEVRGVLSIAIPLLFVWGMLSERLARSAVGDLVAELDRPLPPEGLQSALARALRDPTLEIVYAIGDGRWVDCDGRPVAAPSHEAEATGRVSPVERDGEVLAALVHDRALEPGVVQAAGIAAGMAIANERLRAQVRAQLEDVRASRRRIVEAGDAARRRVERDLHDGAQQRLVGLTLGLRMLEERCRDVPDAVQAVEALQAELRDALRELRELARGLHPQILTEEGLGAAIESLAERAGVPVRVRVAADDERLPEPVEATAYFVVAEALTNVSKYARATSATVAVARSNGSLLVDVSDDGVGGATPAAGSGLLGLEDRVAALGGTLAVDSPPGAGTHLHAEIPCA